MPKTAVKVRIATVLMALGLGLSALAGLGGQAAEALPMDYNKDYRTWTTSTYVNGDYRIYRYTDYGSYTCGGYYSSTTGQSHSIGCW